MHTKSLETEEEYKQAMAEIDKLFDLDPDLGTPEADRFELLASLIETYEDKWVATCRPPHWKP